MRKLILALLFAPSLAWAQGAGPGQNVITGYIASSGCPAGQATCFIQYGPGGGGGGESVVIIPSSSASAGITPVVSSAAESNHVLKNAAGNLYSLSVTSGAASGFVLVFNATSSPGDGAVTPIDCWSLPANSTLASSWNPGPAQVFSTGITAVFSTTGCFTKTASATAFFNGAVQ